MLFFISRQNVSSTRIGIFAYFHKPQEECMTSNKGSVNACPVSAWKPVKWDLFTLPFRVPSPSLASEDAAYQLVLPVAPFLLVFIAPFGSSHPKMWGFSILQSFGAMFSFVFLPFLFLLGDRIRSCDFTYHNWSNVISRPECQPGHSIFGK